MAGHVQMVDVGEVNGRIFVNNSSVGIYPRMVWERDAEQRRGRRKAVAFGIAMLRTWRNYRTLPDNWSSTAHRTSSARRSSSSGTTNTWRKGFNWVRARRARRGPAVGRSSRPECGRFEILALPVRALVRRLDPDAASDPVSPPPRSTVELARSRVSVGARRRGPVMRSPLRYRVRPGALRVSFRPRRRR